MRNLTLTLCLTILLPVPCWARTYYVSVYGADTNDGLTTETPFAHHPWDALASDTADDTTLEPGDTVYMKRGHVWYNCTLNVTESGTAASPITTTTLDGFGYGDDPKLVGAYNPAGLSFEPVGQAYMTTNVSVEPRLVIYNGTDYNWRVLTRQEAAREAVGPGQWDWATGPDGASLWVNVGEDPGMGTLWVARRNVVGLMSGCSNVAFGNLDFCVSQSGGTGTVYVTSGAHNITFDGCGFAFGPASLYVLDSEALTIRDCRVWGWTESAGVFASNSTHCTLESCLIDGGSVGATGIRLHNSSANAIRACHIQDCWNGLEYGYGGDGSAVTVSGNSASNRIMANALLGCYAGVILKSASGTGENELGYNMIVNSRVNGISITSSGGLLPEFVYSNTVIHNPSDHDPTAELDYTGHAIAIQATGALATFYDNTIFVSRSGDGCDNCNGLCISDTSDNIVEVRTDYNVLLGVRDAYLAKLVDVEGTHLFRTVKQWQTAIQADPSILDLEGASSQAGSHDTGADTGWTRPFPGM